MRPSLAIDDPVLADFASEVGVEGPVSVRGGGTRFDVGGRLDPSARVLGAPAGIVDHVPDEMVVTVRAGTAVSELHAVLAAAGQRTRLPERAEGTVGGALMVGDSDLHRLGRGHVRDCLLQARYVSAEGRVITAGGPTVKNVSGFDLCRLLVGSLGTLGLLAEVILRTEPVPPASVWLRGDGADPFAILTWSRAASSILWDGERTWVHLEGFAADVADERARLTGFAETDASPELPRHARSSTPAEIASLPRQGGGGFVAEVGVGRVHTDQPAPPVALDPVVAALNRRIKDQFDPTGRLNPGRDPQRR